MLSTRTLTTKLIAKTTNHLDELQIVAKRYYQPVAEVGFQMMTCLDYEGSQRTTREDYFSPQNRRRSTKDPPPPGQEKMRPRPVMDREVWSPTWTVGGVSPYREVPERWDVQTYRFTKRLRRQYIPVQFLREHRDGPPSSSI